MAGEKHLDIRIRSTDPTVISSVENTLRDLSPTRQEAHRDLATVLAIAGSAVALARGLIALWKEARALKTTPDIKVEKESGIQLDLAKVRTEDEIHKFVAD
ncbi:MAG: hypothetical protein ACLQDV_25010 [Candidatus Binataceae bacterium]